MLSCINIRVAAHPLLPVQAIEELQIAEEKIIFVINYNENKLQKKNDYKTINYQPFVPEEKTSTSPASRGDSDDKLWSLFSLQISLEKEKKRDSLIENLTVSYL